MPRVRFWKKTGALPSPKPGQLAPPHAPQTMGEPFKPVSSPTTPSCPSLPFDKSEPGHDATAKACWSWASLRGWTMSALPWGSLAHQTCQGNISIHQCLVGWDRRSRWQERAGEGAKPREPLGGAQGQRLSSPGSRAKRFGVPPKPPASVSPLSDQVMLHRSFYLVICGNYGRITV